MKETTQSSSMKLKMLILGLACACPLASQAVTPWLPEQLVLSATMTDVPGSNYNPRIVDGYNYVTNTAVGNSTWARYAAGSSVATTVNAGIGNDQRMVSTLGGSGNSTYIMGSGGTTTPFKRYDWNGANMTTAATPAVPATNASEAFAWVDSDTILANSYQANRNRLYLMDVVADTPSFSLSLNTASAGFGGLGYKDTSATRICTVSVSNGYAYYGDSTALAANPGFYALDLSTGVESPLGTWGSAVSGYAGIWTVVAQDGYLYVQTVNNGIKVFSLASPTTLGSLYTTYTQGTLDGLTGQTTTPTVGYFGFDVNTGVAAPRMLLWGVALERRGSSPLPSPNRPPSRCWALACCWRCAARGRADLNTGGVTGVKAPAPPASVT